MTNIHIFIISVGRKRGKTTTHIFKTYFDKSNFYLVYVSGIIIFFPANNKYLRCFDLLVCRVS